MILYISDAGPHGSGYSEIAKALARRIEPHEHVVILSPSYTGEEEHFEDYSIVPSRMGALPAQIAVLCRSEGVDVSAVIFAFDIPIILDIYSHVMRQGGFANVPTIGIFPVESGPLMDTWAMELWQLNRRFVLSEFGKRACEEAHLPVEYLPIPANDVFHRDPDFDRTVVLDRLGLPHDTFLVLTVADNQERKNLPGAMEMFAGLAFVVEEARYVLVTRMESRAGWNLKSLIRFLGLEGKVILLNHDLPVEHLADLYRAADVGLWSSKAEGLCLPARECMRCGTLVVGTDTAALSEQLAHGGLPIRPGFFFTDPFGNAQRVYPEVTDGVSQLLRVYHMTPEEKAARIEQATAYAGGFSWERSAEVVLAQLREFKEETIS